MQVHVCRCSNVFWSEPLHDEEDMDQFWRPFTRHPTVPPSRECALDNVKLSSGAVSCGWSCTSLVPIVP